MKRGEMHGQGISDDRLRAVAEHGRGWLFGSAAKHRVKKQPRPRTKVRTTKQNPGLRIYSA